MNAESAAASIGMNSECSPAEWKEFQMSRWCWTSVLTQSRPWSERSPSAATRRECNENYFCWRSDGHVWIQITNDNLTFVCSDCSVFKHLNVVTLASYSSSCGTRQWVSMNSIQKTCDEITRVIIMKHPYMNTQSHRGVIASHTT